MERVVVSVCNESGFNHRFVTAEAVMVGIGFMVVHTLTLTNFRNHVGTRRPKLDARRHLYWSGKTERRTGSGHSGKRPIRFGIVARGVVICVVRIGSHHRV